MKHRKTFLGIGWKFPPTFDKRIRSVEMVSEEEDIKESLYLLLSTRPGERVMNPEYGCAIHTLLFESTNTASIARMQQIIDEAIASFEPRIMVNDIAIVTDQQKDGILYIQIDYTVSMTNTRNNLVFPYYLIEGTEVTL